MIFWTGKSGQSRLGHFAIFQVFCLGGDFDCVKPVGLAEVIYKAGLTNRLREPLKIAFVTRTSEIFSGKAEGQNRRRRSQSYVEDEFWPDNATGENCSRSQ